MCAINTVFAIYHIVAIVTRKTFITMLTIHAQITFFAVHTLSTSTASITVIALNRKLHVHAHVQMCGVCAIGAHI